MIKVNVTFKDGGSWFQVLLSLEDFFMLMATGVVEGLHVAACAIPIVTSTENGTNIYTQPICYDFLLKKWREPAGPISDRRKV